MTHGWTCKTPPFHEGELRIQERVGVRERTEIQGLRVIRDHLPDQHREFYENLPFLLLGSVDSEGRPWASLVAGPTGFIQSPDAGHIHLNTTALSGDPLNKTLQEDTYLGVLGIEPATRRRNRFNGRAAHVEGGGFDIFVDQSFGNCPKFIQTRDVTYVAPSEHRFRPAVRDASLSDADVTRAITTADTFFIATAYSDGSKSAAMGADVSHRGGKPGFVRIADENSILFPDFVGNNHFNTLGNIELNPQAGLLFIDFEKNGLVYMTGKAETIWDGPDLDRFEGAKRLTKITPIDIIVTQGTLPLRFEFGDYSPFLSKTGSW
ncbi:pyridoxamine 5'-phosphate oxidase family protein [Parvibaculaceae bacterium PLY_AMNH_Bact1]|nr:pyridoxamine 5'-phosphate oxidase family protein [Parvibaculaceae bacterium PLY_AMNH_Bact1]